MTDRRIQIKQKIRDENEILVADYLAKGGKIRCADMSGFPPASEPPQDAKVVKAGHIAMSANMSIGQLAACAGMPGFPRHYVKNHEAYFIKGEAMKWLRKHNHAGALNILSGKPKKPKEHESE